MTAVQDFLTDLRFSLRLFTKNASITAIAALSLALGIGASSAIFSLIYAVLIDPYPYQNADRIIAPTFGTKLGDHGRMFYTVPDYLQIVKASRTIEGGLAFDNRNFVTTRGLPEQVKGDAYAPDGFEFMGVPAMLGRTFGPQDIPSPAAPPRIVVLSYLFWQRHFSGDPKIVGKTLELNHDTYTILGVLPPRFTWGDRDVYVPLPMVPDNKKALDVMLRVRPRVNLAAVSKELQAFAIRFAKGNPNVYPKDFQMSVTTLNDWLLGKFKGTLWILMSAVGLLLLIACGNVSILLLARANSRRKEVGVRISLGATQQRLVRQFLTESVLLAFAGGLLGVLLAYRGVPAIVALMPEYSVPHEAVIHVNGMVVLFTFIISVATGILFGMAPALQLAKPDVRDAMQESGRSFTGSRQSGKTRSTLIIAEVALTMVLLVSAGIALRGFFALTQTPLGFDSSNVMTFAVETPEGVKQTWESRRLYFQKILAALRTVPGVNAASTAIAGLPPRIYFETEFQITDRPSASAQRTLVSLIGGDYFSTIHVPLLRGRTFTDGDFDRVMRVAVINEEMRKQYWSDGRDPIGSIMRVPQMKFEDNVFLRTPPNFDPAFQIVGVVATARNQGLHDPPKPAIYVPYTFVMPTGCTYLIRTAYDPHKFEKTFRERVRSVNPEQAIAQERTLDEVLSLQERAYPRFSSTLFTIFAAVALLLAASGIYSVVSFVVTQRTHEFGIRMALGARAADVLQLVAGMTARLMLTGIAIGLLGAFSLSKIIGRYVDGWDPKDPIAFIVVTTVMLGVGLVACWAPTYRAASIAPMIALRHE